MISACAESQGWEEAVTIFDEMMANEVAPDIKSAWAAHGDTSQSPVGFGYGYQGATAETQST